MHFDCLPVYCVIEEIKCNKRSIFVQFSVATCGNEVGQTVVFAPNSFTGSSNSEKKLCINTTNTLFTAKNDDNLLNLKSFLIVAIWLCQNLHLHNHVNKREFLCSFHLICVYFFPIRMSIRRIEVSQWTWKEFSLYLSIQLLLRQLNIACAKY